MKTNKDIGFFRKLVLKLLTKFQEMTIKVEDTNFYLSITKAHFKIYYGLDLVKEAVNNSREFRKAANRHGNMVITLLHRQSKRKKYLKKKIMEAFHKDLLLQSKEL